MHVLFHLHSVVQFQSAAQTTSSIPHITRQLHPPPLPLPLHHPLRLHNILQPPAHLHNPAPDHPRIDGHRLPDQLLDGGGGVEAKDEVVA